MTLEDFQNKAIEDAQDEAKPIAPSDPEDWDDGVEYRSTEYPRVSDEEMSAHRTRVLFSGQHIFSSEIGRLTHKQKRLNRRADLEEAAIIVRGIKGDWGYHDPSMKDAQLSREWGKLK